MTIAKSLSDDTPHTIDITPTIGHAKRVPPDRFRDDSNCYWLLPHMNINDEAFRKNKLYPIILRACQHAGFHARCNYSQKDGGKIIVTCLRSRYKDKSKKDPSNKPSKSRGGSRSLCPNKEDEDEDNQKSCNFKFSVYWDERIKRWFVPHLQSGNIHHCGHFHLDPSLIRMPSHVAVNAEELQIAKDALESNISPSATQSLVQTRTDANLEVHQLSYLKRKVDRDNLIMNGASNVETVADRLVSWLTSDPTKSFILLFAENDPNSGLLKIKKRKQHMNNAVVVESFLDDLGDATETPLQYAASMRIKSDLVHSASGEILLACAWTNDNARRKFDMFPEFMGGDDTDETNSEERPLYTLCGKDNENKAFAHTWCFMPSKAQWAYSFIL